MSENEAQTEQTFLIYGEGYPDEGQKLSAEALQEELAAGAVRRRCGGRSGNWFFGKLVRKIISVRPRRGTRRSRPTKNFR